MNLINKDQRTAERLFGDSTLPLDNFQSIDNTAPNPSGLTLPDIHKYIIPHSPHHQVRLLILLLQDYFSTGLPDDYTFKYSPDINKSQILFDTEYNLEGDAKGRRPVVVGSVNSYSFGRTSLGNVMSGTPNTIGGGLSQVSMKHGGLAQTSLALHIVSPESAATATVATLIMYYLASIQTFLPKLIGAHQIIDIQMSGISPIVDYDNLYMSTVSLVLSSELRWTQYVKVDQEIFERLSMVVSPKPLGKEDTIELDNGNITIDRADTSAPLNTLGIPSTPKQFTPPTKLK